MDYTKHINQTDMTTSFADFVATQDARNDIQLKIREYCLMLCEALEQDFVQESIKRAISSVQTMQSIVKRLADIKSGKDMYKFSIESGRKYHKIVMETEQQSKSVHCLLTRRLVKCTRQHHSKHLPRMVYVSTC